MTDHKNDTNTKHKVYYLKYHPTPSVYGNPLHRNLQGAVGSYFDYHSSGLRLPSMRHISTQQGTTLPPQIQ